MGEWFDYRVRFKDDESITERLIKDGYAETYTRESDNFTGLTLHIAKIDKVITSTSHDDRPRCKIGTTGKYLTDRYKDRDGNSYEDIYVGMDHANSKDYLYYCNKWDSNFGIAIALSYLYPDKIIETVEIPPYYGDVTTAYLCDGAWSNKEGEPISQNIGALWGINQKLIRESKDGMFTVSLPIGTEDDKWGKIVVPEKDISCAEYNDHEDGATKYIPNSVFFTTDEIKVSFKNSTKTYDAMELLQAYSDSINQYKNYMHEQMVLSDFPAENLERRTNGGEGSNNVYYIATIHVPTNVSPDGIVRTTIPQYNISERDDGKRDIVVGSRNKEKTVQIKNGNTNVRLSIKNEDLKRYYDETPQVENDLEQEEDTDMEI